MRPGLRDRHAHPGSAHAAGGRARLAIETARGAVADWLGVPVAEVTFTSGALEANNLGIRGVQGINWIGVAAHEPPAILHPARSRAATGARLRRAPVTREGGVCPADLVGDGPGLVAVSHAHPELGTLQPVPVICARARAAHAFVLVDASLTAGRIDVRRDTLGGPDLLSVSFHHLGGPGGIGVLAVRAGLHVAPLLVGGVEEHGLRPGPLSLAAIVGAGVAAQLAQQESRTRRDGLDQTSRELLPRILATPRVALAGPCLDSRLPGHLAFVVDGVDGGALTLSLAARGVLTSSGSDCGTAGLPSAALRAAGLDAAAARSVVVFCLSPVDPVPSRQALDRVALAFRESVDQLRNIAGCGDPAPG
jgi:cysteine desulfurase